MTTIHNDISGLPKISVVTPSFNQAQYIEQTIVSVLHQNYPNFEHIVIDGESTDGTIGILRKYPHLKWFSEKDNGQSDALNKGFRMASGDIIAWVNSDDWYEPGVFEVFAAYFETYPERNVVMGDCNLVDLYGNIFDNVINYERGFEELKKHWVSRSIPTQPAIFFRRQLFDEYGYLDENLHFAMDYDLWMRFAQKNRFYHLDRTAANYRFHSSAKGGDQNWNKFIPDCVNVYKRYCKPIVSVIIPCYNYAHYLPEAVTSVIKQTFQNFEIIIVNDGSADNTREVAEHLIASYPCWQIRLISQPNSGSPAVSRNAGIRDSRGSYILPIDADDRLDPTFLEKAVAILEAKPGIGLVYSHIQHFGTQQDVYQCGEFRPETLASDNVIPYCALFRRDLWSSVDGYRTDVGYEDWHFWLDALEKGWRGHLLPEPLFLYRKHNEGRLCDDNAKRQLLLAEIVDRHPKFYPEETRRQAQINLMCNQPNVSKSPGHGRVLIACSHFWPSIGGVETIAENLGNQLANIGYMVDVATWTYTGRTSDQHRGVRIISFDTSQVQNGIPLWVLRLRQLVLSGDYTACIMLADPLNQIIWSIENAKFPPQTRLFIQPLINEDGYATWRENREFRSRLTDIFRNSNGVIALTRNGTETCFFREENIPSFYIPNATTPLSLQGNFRVDFNIPENTFLMVHVANLWPVKNHDGLLKTLQNVDGDWLLVMIGHETDNTEYVELVRHLASANKRVILIPGLSPDKTSTAMDAADLVLLSSHGEVSPVTILEAMSHATPWIATPQCGAVHDVTGGIVAPLAEFPNYIELLRNNPEILRKLGNTGFEHWQQCFSWDTVTNEWCNLIKTGAIRNDFSVPPEVFRQMEDIRQAIDILWKSDTLPQPMVSVIIPTYNRSEMLRTAIQSVLNQTFQDFEIIVVNDAGEDVEHVIKAFKSPKTIYIRHEINKGIAAARNTSIRASRGKYVAYLDDDDIFYPNHLEVLVTHLEKCGGMVAYTDASRIFQQKDGDCYIIVKREVPYSEEFDYDKILVDNFIPVPCIMHARECLQKSGFFDETLHRHEDWDLWIRMSRYYEFSHISKVTCEYSTRLDGSGMTSGTLPTFISTYKAVCSKYADLVQGKRSIITKQKKSLLDLIYQSYEFLIGILDRAGFVSEAPLSDDLRAALRTTGASEAQISSAAYCQLGIKKEYDPERALRFFEVAVGYDPDNIKAQKNASKICFGRRLYKQGIRHLEAIYTIDPYQIDLVNSMANMASLCNDHVKAQRYYYELLDLDPSNSDALNYFASHFHKDKRDSISTTAKANEQQLTVVVFSGDLPKYACAQLRLIAPLHYLHESIDLKWAVGFDGSAYQVNIGMIESADLIVIQRFFPMPESQQFIEKMLASGKPIIYETDDSIMEIPLSNDLDKLADKTTSVLRNLLPIIDAITVSTTCLSEKMRSFNASTFVLPNCLNENEWNIPPRIKQAGEPVIIGFAGTPSHKTDLEWLEECLLRVNECFKEKIHFIFMGCSTERLSRLPNAVCIPFSDDYRNYAINLQNAGMDIALVPLENIAFNYHKSNIKWLEYSACGVAGIYADLSPYNTSVEHGTTGLLVANEPQQWFNAIDLLIRNPELRRSIAMNARHKVMAEYTLKAGAHRWLEVYRGIVARHTACKSAPANALDSPLKIVTRSAITSNEVSIIIPLFNQAAFTKRCMEALTTNTKHDLYELILVDNGSYDATQALLANQPATVKIIRNQTNQGFARACNQGAQAAGGKYLLFLNNDTEPRIGWLEALIGVLDADATVAGVGSKLLYPDGTIQHAGVSIVDNRISKDPLCGEHIWKGRPSEQPEANQFYRYQALTAACLLVRRDAFEAVQGFDEGYWNGYEDVDLCFKLGQKGWRLVYQPASVVVHHESKSGSERFAGVSRNVQRLHEKWLGKIQPDIIINTNSIAEEGKGISCGSMGPYVSGVNREK